MQVKGKMVFYDNQTLVLFTRGGADSVVRLLMKYSWDVLQITESRMGAGTPYWFWVVLGSYLIKGWWKSKGHRPGDASDSLIWIKNNFLNVKTQCLYAQAC